MKRISLFNLLASICICFCLAFPLEGYSSEVGSQVEKLQRDNEALKRRIKKLEDDTKERRYLTTDKQPTVEIKSHMHRLVQQEIQAQLAASEDPLARYIKKNVSLNGLVEVEAFVADQESDIALSTVELAFEATLSEWAKTNVLLLWEEGEGPVDVDEATISVGNTEKNPFYLTAGKMFVPFGNYDTFMIQDTLTHELGEIGDTAVVFGFEDSSGVHAAVYAYNGPINKSGEKDRIDSYGAHLAYEISGEKWGLTLAGDWSSNIGDSEVVSDLIYSNIPAGEVADYVAGMALYGALQYKKTQAMGEYVKALDNFQSSEFQFNGSGAQPEAWNVELAYVANILEKEVTLAAGYQGTKQSVDLELPEKRYMASISTDFTDIISLTLEYRHDKDYSISEGGNGEDADVVSTLLAVAF